MDSAIFTFEKDCRDAELAEGRPCLAESPAWDDRGEPFYCTRDPGHPGPHVAHTPNGRPAAGWIGSGAIVKERF